MSQPKYSKSFLAVNNKILDHNFSFRVIRSSEDLTSSAEIYITKKQFLADNLSVNIGDSISISIKNDNENPVTIFDGVVGSVSKTNEKFKLLARFVIVENKEFYETYKDSTLQNVLSQFISNIKFEASDPMRIQTVLRGYLLSALGFNLRVKHFFIDLARNLVIRDTAEPSKTYNLDKCYCDVRIGYLLTIPLPTLDIDDAVEYHGQKYIAKNIVYDHIYMPLMKVYFNPSRHVTDIEKKGSNAIDVNDKDDYSQTATNFYNKHKRSASGYKGSTYYHMSFK